MVKNRGSSAQFIRSLVGTHKFPCPLDRVPSPYPKSSRQLIFEFSSTCQSYADQICGYYMGVVATLAQMAASIIAALRTVTHSQWHDLIQCTWVPHLISLAKARLFALYLILF